MRIETTPHHNPEQALPDDFDESHFIETYGLGRDDLTSMASYSDPETGQPKSGTLYSAITGPGCPVGQMLARGFKKDGGAGLQEVVDKLVDLDPNIDIQLSTATLERRRPMPPPEPAADPKKNFIPRMKNLPVLPPGMLPPAQEK